MSRWRVMVYQWECEVEADDEGEALMEADSLFNFMSEGRAQEIEQEEECGHCGGTGEVACSSTSYMSCPACSKRNG